MFLFAIAVTQSVMNCTDLFGKRGGNGQSSLGRSVEASRAFANMAQAQR